MQRRQNEVKRRSPFDPPSQTTLITDLLPFLEILTVTSVTSVTSVTCQLHDRYITVTYFTKNWKVDDLSDGLLNQFSTRNHIVHLPGAHSHVIAMFGNQTYLSAPAQP